MPVGRLRPPCLPFSCRPGRFSMFSHPFPSLPRVRRPLCAGCARRPGRRNLRRRRLRRPSACLASCSLKVAGRGFGNTIRFAYGLSSMLSSHWRRQAMARQAESRQPSRAKQSNQSRPCHAKSKSGTGATRRSRQAQGSSSQASAGRPSRVGPGRG